MSATRRAKVLMRAWAVYRELEGDTRAMHLMESFDRTSHYLRGGFPPASAAGFRPKRWAEQSRQPLTLTMASAPAT